MRQRQFFSMYPVNMGKSERQRQAVEAALNEGKTVYDGNTGELRGAGTAKDVTPACQHIWVVQGDGHQDTVCERCGDRHPTDDTERELLSLLNPSD